MENGQPAWSELRAFSADEAGGSLMEYTLIAALVLVVAALVVLAVRKTVTTV